MNGPVTKGGDDRTGAYDLVEHFWKPAPNHGTEWTWGSIAAVATDGPDRIFVTAWGDRPVARPGQAPAQGQSSRLRMQNLITVVDRNGNMVENWSQWDSVMTQPHRIMIDPYDPERHVWGWTWVDPEPMSRYSSSLMTESGWCCGSRTPFRSSAPPSSASDSRTPVHWTSANRR